MTAASSQWTHAVGVRGRSGAACCSQQGIDQQNSMMCLVHGTSERAVRGSCALLRSGVAARAARADSIGGRAGAVAQHAEVSSLAAWPAMAQYDVVLDAWDGGA